MLLQLGTYFSVYDFTTAQTSPYQRLQMECIMDAQELGFEVESFDEVLHKMEFQYDVLVSRNFPLLTKEDQGKIRQTRLLVAGCGIGSVIAELAARVGFGGFVLVDADNVELKNINRQGYTLSDVGKNKAETLAIKISEINPQCSVTAMPVFLDANNASNLIGMADIVVDAIDALAPGAATLLHTEATNQGKPVVCPFNLGWGGGVVVVTPDSASLAEMLGVFSDADDLLEEDLFDLMRRLTGGAPDYLVKALGKLKLREVTKYPQPATAVQQCSALAVTATVRLALGLPTAVAPHFISFDPWLASDVARDKA